MGLAPGTRLGPYAITSVLGAGGMGEVYRARDTRLDRDVAIKLLTRAEAGEAADRLLREARSASALNHPNICTLHEIGDAGGRPFIVMELVNGKSLDHRIAGRGMPLPAALRIGVQIADALAHAHARGVIHRDLKAANVAITEDGRAKILDFGIATRISTDAVDEATRSITALDADRAIAGTLPYMAPELLQGQPADARSDLWALGVMIVEMATGRLPFRAETGFALSTAILRDPPDVPPSVPPGLSAAILRLLAKDPAARYQSAAEVRAALESLQSAGHVPATTGAAGRTAQRAAVMFAAFALLAVLTVIGWMTLRGSGDTPAVAPIGSVAVLPLRNDSGDEEQQYFADGMTEALISDLSAIENLHVISRTSVMQFRDTTQPLTAIADRLRVDGIVEGSVLRAADRIRIIARLIDTRTERQVWSNEYEEPLSDAITLQREIARTIGGEIRGQLSPADQARLARRTEIDPQAFQSYLRGRFYWNRRNSDDLKQAAALFQDAIARDPGFALAHAGLADVYVVMGDNRDVLPAEAYGRARESVELALRLDPSLAEAHTTGGWLAFAVERDWQSAEQGFTRALELNAGYATAHQWRGEFLAALGRFDEALASLKRAGELDPLAPMPQAIYGWVAYLAGRYDEAVATCNSVLQRNPGFRPARMYRAWSYMETGRLREAEEDVTTLLKTTSSRAVPVATLGRIHARRGNRTAAERALTELQALSYPPSFDIAKVYAELREREAALEWLRRAATERNSAVLYVNVDRTFAWLGDDSDFDALLELLKLKQPGD